MVQANFILVDCHELLLVPRNQLCVGALSKEKSVEFLSETNRISTNPYGILNIKHTKHLWKSDRFHKFKWGKHLLTAISLCVICNKLF